MDVLRLANPQQLLTAYEKGCADRCNAGSNCSDFTQQAPTSVPGILSYDSVCTHARDSGE